MQQCVVCHMDLYWVQFTIYSTIYCALLSEDIKIEHILYANDMKTWLYTNTHPFSVTWNMTTPVCQQNLLHRNDSCNVRATLATTEISYRMIPLLLMETSTITSVCSNLSNQSTVKQSNRWSYLTLLYHLKLYFQDIIINKRQDDCRQLVLRTPFLDSFSDIGI